MNTRMDYLKLLQESYDVESFHNVGMSKHAYLSEHIFDFVTYDDDIADTMGVAALSVCVAITEGKTYELIRSSTAAYVQYLNNVNMKFFENKLEWGGSIRGAWWNLHGDEEFELSSCGLYEGNEQVLSIKFKLAEWVLFVSAMSKFVATIQTDDGEVK
jgi:hypothetical protein